MSLNYGDTSRALENRRLFLEAAGINYRDLVCAKQVHGDEVKFVNHQDKGRGALSYDNAITDADAFITNEKNLPLAVFTADCLSIFLYDPKDSAIGLVHAGWRGTQKNITAKTIKLMQQKFNTNPQDLYASFSPAIRGCCYEVGEEFKGFFSSGVVERDNHYYLDLVGLNKKQILDLKMQEANISDCGICTYCRNREFFSYRKEGDSCGRMMSVIMLK
jgi:hypothetical protein